MDIINFFREDLSEVLGVYCDGEKIFLARLASEIEMAEIDLEFDSNNNISYTERLAEKIKITCTQRGWKISKVGITLREGTAATFQTDFKNIPANEIESAVKIWATAHVGKEASYTSIKIGDEIWMEALPISIVEEYILAFEKNSLQLCAITEFPPVQNDERPLTPYNLAIFAADIIRNNKSPNILPQKISNWNVKKISLTAAAIFFIVLAGFSANLASDYFPAVKRAETAQKRFNSLEEDFILKNNLDAVTAKIKHIDKLISTQNITAQNFNSLIKIGKIPNEKIIIDKIKTTGETLELEGVSESPESLKLYLNRLKNFVSPKVKLKNSTEIDGQIIFSVNIIF